ncbi:hypothetical protein WJX84_005987 [Apatococcus fuscideae]|uniref:Uncharacterized protein n=1 Tax=Apatococcus fuscideae TaxID=2026836 RepID=A0AAW1TKW5_9CHLO
MVDPADVQRLFKTIDKDQSCGPVWDKVEELTRRVELYHDFLAQLASKQQLQDWLHHKSSGREEDLQNLKSAEHLRT